MGEAFRAWSDRSHRECRLVARGDEIQHSSTCRLLGAELKWSPDLQPDLQDGAADRRPDTFVGLTRRSANVSICPMLGHMFNRGGEGLGAARQAAKLTS